VSVDANRQIVIDAWNAIEKDRDGSGLATYLSDGYVRHSGDHDYSREDFVEVVRDLYVGFPDLSTTIEPTVAEGDCVASRWVSIGTHLGPYLGVPPTHKRVVASGITITRLQAGVIVEEWASWHKVNVLYALGIVPIS
jgi:predicted ester cyclase